MLLAAFAGYLLSVQELTWIAPPAPNPEEDGPRNPWVLAEDPAWTCSDIGDLYFPAGRLKSVRWYTDSTGRIGPGDPQGWEKRSMLAFDKVGHCVELESWSLGSPRYREVLQSPTADHEARTLSWDGYFDTSCWIREPICDEAGRELARRVTTWTAEGLGGKDGDSWIDREYAYDAAGRLVAIIARSQSSPQNDCRTEFARDEDGRVRRIRFEVGEPHRCATTEIEYDERGRVAARSWQYDGDSARHATCYQYDPAGHLVEECATLDGRIGRLLLWEYDDGGRLRNRWVFEDPVDSEQRLRREALSTEETYDGADRPKSRLVRNARGQTIEHFGWGYANDARGNWTRRIPHRLESELLEDVNEYADVLRVIEYAD